MQGGPHNHSIGGIAVSLLEVQSPEFKDYAQRTLSNSKALASSLLKRNFELAAGGTDNHMIIFSTKPYGLPGYNYEALSNYINVILNDVPYPTQDPSIPKHGIRVGTAGWTTRGYTEKDMELVAEFLDRILKESIKIQNISGLWKSKFKSLLADSKEAAQLKRDVEIFASQFEWPGANIW